MCSEMSGGEDCSSPLPIVIILVSQTVFRRWEQKGEFKVAVPRNSVSSNL